MGNDSADAPDVLGAAGETGRQARILNAEQTRANRPNQSNAWGSTSWTDTQVLNPVTGLMETQWNQTETLNPLMQQSLDSQMAIGAGRSSLAEGAMARAWDQFSQPMDFDQYGGPIAFNPEAGPQDFNYDKFQYDAGGERQRAEDAAYSRAQARLDPQFTSQQQALETKLRNQGLSQGDQAYDAAMKNFTTGRNDAYEMARLGSVGEGRTEALQNFQQALQTQGTQYGQAHGASQLNAQLQNQRFGQGAQSNQIANALRTQQVQEDLFKPGFTLDEVDRWLAGQKIEGGPPSTGGKTSTGQGETKEAKYLGG